MIEDTTLKDYQFLKSWIEERTDNAIKNITLERQILAFYLLEKLIQTNVEFIFKGGTALILLLEETKRFSTDIDILISRPDLGKLEDLFSNFARSDQVFTRFERDLRLDSKFPKAHYKFFFNSIYKNDDQDGYILLDAVFEENPYLSLESKVVKNKIFPSTEPYITVRIPSVTDILMDKLTAFAPKTIGVKFDRISDDISRDHSREVIKQWFDVNELYQKCDDISNLQARYIKLSKFEIEQRELSLDYVICLKDTFDVVLNYLSKGKKDPEVYNKITKGIRRLSSFVNMQLTGSYFISASVNVIELISKVLCDDDTRYQKILTDSKERLPYEEFTRAKQLKNIVDLVKVNNKLDWERFIISVRVINEFFEI